MMSEDELSSIRGFIQDHTSPNTNTTPNPNSNPSNKRKRNLPGTPDPDAEVIALSPKSLMATNRFICKICNKGFQRDQNLQLHRRGHNLPWKLKQRSNKGHRQEECTSSPRRHVSTSTPQGHSILSGESSPYNSIVGLGGPKSLGSMKKLYFLVERCFELREPALLVGKTGGGKTTVCQLLSACLQLKLHILNCHQYTETSDFIGGFRPIRDRFRLISNYEEIIEQLKKLKAFTCYPEDHLISSGIDQASSTIDLLNSMIRKYKEGRVCSADVNKEDLYAFEQLKLNLDVLHQKWQSIFEWQDGPLVKCRSNGETPPHLPYHNPRSSLTDLQQLELIQILSRTSRISPS